MRAILRGLGAVTLALAASGCWPMPGQNPDRTGYNPIEAAITPATVSNLELRWRADLAVTPPYSPVMSPGGVHVAGRCVLHTLDPSSGATRWTAALLDPPELPCGTATQPVVVDTPAGPRIVGSVSYVTSPIGEAQPQGGLFDPAGERLAALDYAGAQTARGSQVVFAHDNHNQSNPGTFLAVVEVGPGPRLVRQFRVDLREDVTATLGPLEDHKVFQAGSGPMATGPENTSRGQAVRAYSTTEPHTGCAVDWLPDMTQPVECPLWVTPTDGKPTAPVIGDEGATLYAGTDAGTLYALDASTGAVRWTASLGSAVGTPALAGGTLYVQTAAGRLVALPAGGCGAPTCTPAWEAATGGGTTQPAVAGGVVITTSSQGLVQAFDAAGCSAPTCPPLWEDNSGLAGMSAPAVSGGQVYVTADGAVLAYGLG
jgi:hypothetical protein